MVGAPQQTALSALAADLGTDCALLTSEAAALQDASHALLARLPPDGKQQPLLIARPRTAEEVAKCVRCAADAKLSLSVIGGAHSVFCGLAQIVVDLHHFSDVRVDEAARTIKAGGGAQLKAIAEAAATSGLMVPLGTAPTVGMGLVLQAGFGHLTRLCGMAVDAVISAELVVADGSCLRVSSSENPELFWALRGFAPNFGVVLSVTLTAWPLPCSQPFTQSRWIFSAPSVPGGAAALLASYTTRAAAMPRNISSDCILHFDDEGKLLVGIFDYAVGESGDGAADMPGELMKHSTVPSLSQTDLFEYEPYLKIQPEGTLLPPGDKGFGFFPRCVFWSAPDVQKVEKLIELMAEAPCHHCHVHFQHAGGAAGQRDVSRSSFAFPSIEWSVVIMGCWPRPDTDDFESRCPSWVMKAVRTLLPSCVGTYTVDLGPEDKELAKFAVGSARGELLRLKQVWDPNGVFGAGAFPLEALRPARNCTLL